MNRVIRTLAMAGLLCGAAFAIPVFRVDPAPVMTTAGNAPAGGFPALYAVAGASVQVCTDTACATPATAFTDATGNTACPLTAPIVLAGTSLCTTTTGPQGQFGFWLAPGTYYYRVTFPTGQSFGNFPLTSTTAGVTSMIAGTGISVSGSTGAVTVTNTGAISFNGRTGAVTPTTGDYTYSQIGGAVQGNTTKPQMAGTNSGAAAAPLCNDANGNATTSGCGAGISASGTQSQYLGITPNTGNNTTFRFVTPPQLNSFDYIMPTQTPGGSIAAGVNTVTLAPCPQGFVSGGFAASTFHLAAGTGAAEDVQSTGGSCTPGGGTGTVVFAAANTHTGAWTISDATNGIQFAIGAATINGGGVVIVPGPGVLTNTASVYIPTNVKVQLGFVQITGPGATYASSGSKTGCQDGVFRLTGNYAVLAGMSPQASKIISACATGRVVLVSNSTLSLNVLQPEVSGMTIDITAVGGSTVGLEVQTAWYPTFRRLYITHTGAGGGTGDGVLVTDTDLAGNGVGAYFASFEDCRVGDFIAGAIGFGGAGIHLASASGTFGITNTNFWNTYASYNAVGFKLDRTGGGTARWTQMVGGGSDNNTSDGVKLTSSDQVTLKNFDVEGNGGWGVNGVSGNSELIIEGGTAFATNASGNVTGSFAKYWDMSDHGAIDRDTIQFNGSLQRWKLMGNGFTDDSQIGYHFTGSILDISHNLQRTGNLTANLTDIAQAGSVISVGTGSFCYFTATAGANPRTLTQQWCTTTANSTAAALVSTAGTTVGTNLSFGANGSHIQTMAANKDISGTCTFVATTCTVTFTTAYGAAPSCTASDQTAAAPVRANPSTTQLVLTGGTGAGATDVAAYHCVGNPN